MIKQLNSQEAIEILQVIKPRLQWEFPPNEDSRTFGLFREGKCVAMSKLIRFQREGIYYLDFTEAFEEKMGYGAVMMAYGCYIALREGVSEDYVLYFESLRDSRLCEYYRRWGAVNYDDSPYRFAFTRSAATELIEAVELAKHI